LALNSSGARLVPRPQTPPSQTAYSQNRTALLTERPLTNDLDQDITALQNRNHGFLTIVNKYSEEDRGKFGEFLSKI
jgi:hypothetical protein